MPLLIHNGVDAVRIRKANEVAAWGHRRHENRVEPIAKPAFDVPFKLKRKERIFTIGSCFARHVETELIQRGFRIPMRDLLAQPAFSDVDTEVVNNFGIPSIYNELAWAFGAENFDEDLAFVEVQKDKFVDLHMVNSIRPAPLELVRERRRGLIEATRTLAKCRVLIMTLGLVELWWDEQAQLYLNTAPLPSVMKKWPERFSLHVLNFEDCRDYLNRALDLCFANGPKNLQVILTVSPVPMMQTHRRMDVMTANSYSKSVLRAVVEHIVTERDQICYFPSYESVTYSDRQIAWADDFVHVSSDIVAFNVERMVNAFTGKKVAENLALPDGSQMPREDAAALLLAERAKQARLNGDGSFFAEHEGTASTSPAYAIEYARFLADKGDYASLIALLENDERLDAQILRAQSLLKIEKYEQVITLVNKICEQGLKGDLHWRMLLEATAAVGTVDDVLAVEQRWIDHNHRHYFFAKHWVGHTLRKIGEYDLAIGRLTDAIEDGQKTPQLSIELALCFLAVDRRDDALDILDNVPGATDSQIQRIRQLRERAQTRLQKGRRRKAAPTAE
jgi:tetratricopeptide (TPR) repeat protein